MVLFSAFSIGAHAQVTTAGSATQAFRIQGITAEERDAIATELAISGQYRISFACVPAGILVIEPVDAAPAALSATHATNAIQARVGNKHVEPDPRSLGELESACANTRNP